MSENSKGNATKVKAEVVKFNPMLDCENGFTDDELVNSIKNKTMRAAVKSYRTKVVAGEKSAWGVAKACARMKIEARNDFESDEALAHFLGLPNRNAFSRLHRLGEYADKAIELGLTTSPVIELLVLSGDKYGKQDINEHLHKIVGMTKDEVRDYVKDFKVAIEDKKETVEEQKSVSDTLIQEEISWKSMLRVSADVLAGMTDDDYTHFVDALHKVCMNFNICTDDFWAGADR